MRTTDVFFAWVKEAHPQMQLTKVQKAFVHFVFDDRDRKCFVWPVRAGQSFMAELLKDFVTRKGTR